MTQVAPEDSGNMALEAMRREAVYHMHITLPSGKVITGEDAVKFTSMFAGRTPDSDTDDDIGNLYDDDRRPQAREPMSAKRHRLAKRAVLFAKLTKPNRHWWERHKHH
jgi:hypothetical protein